MSTQSLDIRSMTIADLEKIVNEYPWFGYARMALYIKLAQSGGTFTEEQLKKCSAFIPELQTIYYKAIEAENGETDIPVIDFNEFNREINIEKAGNAIMQSADSPKNETRYIILGGDYFSREDFESIEQTKSLTISKLGSVDEGESFDNEFVEEDDDLDYSRGFYTETLAAIYAQQGYYEQAIKVYSKLILLYPEKSAYFAALVNEVKSKNN